MEKKNKAAQDSLATRFTNLSDNLKLGLMDLLGQPLYNVLEGKQVKMPFGFKAQFDFHDKNLGFTRQFGKNTQFNFDFNKKNPDPFFGGRDDARVTLKRTIENR